MGNILIGCPPEILKALLKDHLPMPDTIVVPGTLHKYFSSQACLEFPIYHFLFVQQGLARGGKLKVYAKTHVCKALAEMLRVTLLGPNLEEVLESEKRLHLSPETNREKIEQVFKETHFLALKAQDGDILPVESIVDFYPLEMEEERVVYESFENHPAISIKRLGEDSFSLTCDREYRANIRIEAPQSPAYPIKAKRVEPEELVSKTAFSIRCLGASEGFDSKQPANGLLLRMNSKWILWDCPAYLSLHLQRIGLEREDVDAMFISHVHDDHIDIMQTVQDGSRVNLYTTVEIFHCMILKLMAVLDCSYEEAANRYHFIPIYANRPFQLFRSTFEVFYSVHPIPALGLKLSVPIGDEVKRFFISGDNLPKRMVAQLDRSNVFSSSRKKEIDSALPIQSDFDLALVDVGGGMIHGDPEDYFEHKTQVFYTHTGKRLEGLPDHHHQLSSGQRITIHR